MKLEVEMTQEQLNLLILSTEVYARALMNQPDLFADILAEDRFFYDKEDPENDKRFPEWIAARDEFTEKLRAFEPYHGGTEPPIKVKVIDKD